MSKLGALIMASSLAIASLGCVEHVKIESSASPNPFEKKPYFVVLPIDDKALKIGSVDEKTYFQSLDANHRAVFPFDRKAMREAFTKALIARALKLGIRVTPTEEPDARQFTIHATLRRLEPGSFGYGWVSVGSRAEMVITISGPDGKPLDRIALDSETPADDVHPTAGTRWAADGSELGAMTALYLKKRVYGGD
jgi:hypothetical protein